MSLSVRRLAEAYNRGLTWETYFHKVSGGTAAVVGRWYDTSMWSGHYGANPYIGNMLSATPLDRSKVGALYPGPRGFKRRLSRVTLWSTSSTSAPSVFMLCDYLMFYPFISLDTSDEQTLVTEIELPRYKSGEGVMMFLVATVEAGGAQVGLVVNYTNTRGESKTCPYTVQLTASSPVGQILHAGTLADQYGPFLPLAQGDVGVLRVDSVILDTPTGGGYAALVLCKPIIELPFYHYLAPAEVDLLAERPSLPEIEEDAYLGFLFFAGAALGAASRLCGALTFLLED